MKPKFTNAIYADYLNCPYKAYLKISGKNGRKTDFEKMQDRLSNEYRMSAAHYLQYTHTNDRILTGSVLGQFRNGNYDIGISIREESEDFDIIFDGILKDLKQGDDFLPVLFINRDNLSITDKLYLAFIGFMLGSTLERMPSYGKILYGSEYSSLRVRLNKLMSRVRPMVEDIKLFFNSKHSPQMNINIHCQVCEFGNECLNVAKVKDDLTLLSGLYAKKIKKLHNKGIFTINQLSYTFKPRRKRKNNPHRQNPFRPELKALALRENKVHVYVAPELPNCVTEIYLDIESLPDRNFHYLVGPMINDKGTASEYSLWADSKDQEFEIFLNLLSVIKKYSDYVIYHYGQFERKYLK